MVLVVGAAGMLGQATVQEWRGAGHEVAALTRAELDVTNGHQVRDVITRANPAVVINCTAYNQVDQAEDEPAVACDVNAWAVRHLARAAVDAGAVFVHYSTDFVFDGETTRPYSEDDTPNPRSVYGMSKLMGEWMASEVPRAYVLRVESLFGGSASRSTLDRMRATLEAGGKVSAFTDRVVSPSYVPDVASATRRLIEQGAPAGLYHCVNSGQASWFEVATQLRALLPGAPGTLAGVNSDDVPMRARRPRYAALSNAKLASAGIVMPTWLEALQKHLARS